MDERVVRWMVGTEGCFSLSSGFPERNFGSYVSTPQCIALLFISEHKVLDCRHDAG